MGSYDCDDERCTHPHRRRRRFRLTGASPTGAVRSCSHFDCSLFRHQRPEACTVSRNSISTRRLRNSAAALHHALIGLPMTQTAAPQSRNNCRCCCPAKSTSMMRCSEAVVA